MIYKMTVFLTDKEISVVKIRDGEEKFMSFRGNTSMSVESVDDVDDFIEHCYDEYNINDFSELDFDVFIVNVGGNADIYYALIKSFSRNCRKVSAAEASTMLPLALAIKKCIKKGQTAVVSFLSCTYKAVCNDRTGYIDIEESAEIPDITLETGDFSFLHDVNISGFAGDEDEIKRIKAEYEKTVSSLKQKVDILNNAKKQIIEMQNTIEKLNTTVKELHDKNSVQSNTIEELNKLAYPNLGSDRIEEGACQPIKYKCSYCGLEVSKELYLANYCPFCGASNSIVFVFEV